MISGETKKIDGLWLSLSKKSTTNWARWGGSVKVDIRDAQKSKSRLTTVIGYGERVTRTWSKRDMHNFAIWLKENKVNTDSKLGRVSILLQGNLVVEHWEEYVEYDYIDWLAGMGGIMSIGSTIFFWGAYKLAVILEGRSSMGILPQISVVFRNAEIISAFKEQVDTERMLSSFDRKAFPLASFGRKAFPLVPD